MNFPTATQSVLINGTIQSVTISPCVPMELLPFEAEASKAHLLFANSTQHFALRNENNEIIGFCGIIFYSHKVIFKTDYVVPAYRGNNLWQLMFDYRKKIALSVPSVKFIEATCTTMSINLYEKNGAIRVKQYKSFNLIKIQIPIVRQK